MIVMQNIVCLGVGRDHPTYFFVIYRSLTAVGGFFLSSLDGFLHVDESAFVDTVITIEPVR